MIYICISALAISIIALIAQRGSYLALSREIERMNNLLTTEFARMYDILTAEPELSDETEEFRRAQELEERRFTEAVSNILGYEYSRGTKERK